MSEPTIRADLRKYGCRSESDMPCGRVSENFTLQSGTYRVDVIPPDATIDINTDVPGKKGHTIQRGIGSGQTFNYDGANVLYLANPSVTGVDFFMVTFSLFISE